MNIIQYNNKPREFAFNKSLHAFLPPSASYNQNGSKSSIPVNIIETENEFLLDFYAPGFEKNDFKITVDNNLFTVAAELKEKAEKDNVKTVRQEYKINSFKRSFNIDESIDAERISAKFVNGVLTLNLGKKVEVKEPTKNITIE